MDKRWSATAHDVSPARRAAAYLLAVALPAIVLFIQLRAHVVTAPLFMFFFVAVLITMMGGLGPGLVAVVAATVLGNYYFLGIPGEVSIAGSAGRDTLLFMAASLMVALLQGRLRQVTRSLRAAVRSRDEFLAVAGHELANPLSALELQVQGRRRRLLRAAAKRGHEDPRDADLLANIDQELATIARLRGLVRELLDVSRIRSGRLTLHPERVEMAALVRRVVDSFEEAARQAQCEVQVRTEGPVHGNWDPLRLEQVVANLVSNALKYGAGSQVTVALRADGSWAELQVSDRGPGIAPEHHARVFARFERVAATADKAGLGLGLWIVRQIAEASGGRVSVDSAPGRGARFRLRLPMAGMQTPATIKAAGAGD